MSLGVLIVGLGRIGMRYDLDLDPEAHVYSHARAFSRHPGFHLVGGVDIEEPGRAAFEKAYRQPAYGDIGDALQHHSPDVVVIAVPTGHHGDTLRKILDRSHPRAVLCEKPLSYDLNEASNMVRACLAKDIGLYVNYMRRSDPGVAEVKRRFAAGEIGTPAKGIAWYSKGFLHNGSHLFNLLEHWLGTPSGFEVLAAGRLWDGVDPEPDVRVGFERGTVYFLAAREEDYSHYTIELLASNGRLRYERGGGQILWQPALPDPNFSGYTVLSGQTETIASGMDLYQWNVAEQLAAALAGRGARLCTGAQALDTLKAMRTIIDMR